MSKDILVTIVSDDIYSQNWMCLLLVRDWRTRVIAEFTLHDNLAKSVKPMLPKPDLLLVDLDTNQDWARFSQQLNELTQIANHPKVIFIASDTNIRLLRKTDPSLLNGYLLKQDISTSLAWALTFASEGNFVLTPGTEEAFYQNDIALPPNKMVLRGRTFSGLTTRQEEIARLAIIFSIGRRDLADELRISDQWSYGMVSELYTRMGLEEIFSGDLDPYQYLQDDPVIRSHIEEIVEQLGDSKKARDVETLAFHLITMPIIEG